MPEECLSILYAASRSAWPSQAAMDWWLDWWGLKKVYATALGGNSRTLNVKCVRNMMYIVITDSNSLTRALQSLPGIKKSKTTQAVELLSSVCSTWTPVPVKQQHGITLSLLPFICVSLRFLHLLISLVLTTALLSQLGFGLFSPIR